MCDCPDRTDASSQEEETLNIFVLDSDPVKAAQAQCNKHIVKMTTETAQILSTVHYLASPRPDIPMAATHRNHPCVMWTRESLDNYIWLTIHGLALSEEYYKRYGQRKGCEHGSRRALVWLETNRPPLPRKGLTPFALGFKGFPEYIVTGDAVASYRAFYVGQKAKFAKWSPWAQAPDWWPDPLA
jgi:hypothetical protein